GQVQILGTACVLQAMAAGSISQAPLLRGQQPHTQSSCLFTSCCSKQHSFTKTWSLPCLLAGGSAASLHALHYAPAWSLPRGRLPSASTWLPTRQWLSRCCRAWSTTASGGRFAP